MNDSSAELSRVGQEKPESVPVTVRLDSVLVQQLEALGVIDGTKISPQLRKAAQFYIEQRHADPTFPEQVEAARIRVNGVLDSLIES